MTRFFDTFYNFVLKGKCTFLWLILEIVKEQFLSIVEHGLILTTGSRQGIGRNVNLVIASNIEPF